MGSPVDLNLFQFDIWNTLDEESIELTQTSEFWSQVQIEAEKLDLVPPSTGFGSCNVNDIQMDWKITDTLDEPLPKNVVNRDCMLSSGWLESVTPEDAFATSLFHPDVKPKVEKFFRPESPRPDTPLTDGDEPPQFRHAVDVAGTALRLLRDSAVVVAADHSYTLSRQTTVDNFDNLGVQTPSDSCESDLENMVLVNMRDIIPLNDDHIVPSMISSKTESISQSELHSCSKLTFQSEHTSKSNQRMTKSTSAPQTKYTSKSKSKLKQKSKHENKFRSEHIIKLVKETAEEEIDVVSLGTQQPLSSSHIRTEFLPRVPSVQQRQQLQRTVASAMAPRPAGRKRLVPPATVTSAALPRRRRGPGRRGRRFNTDTDSEVESPEIERRSIHNDMERQRRIGLKNLFDELKKQIPATKDKERAPKVVILREAAALCRKLRDDDYEQEALMRRQIKLHAKVKRLRTVLAINRRRN